MTNTRERHLEILAVAAEFINAAGGIEVINALPEGERKNTFNRIVDAVIDRTGCSSRQVARKNVAKAMRKDRHFLTQVANQGGPRTPGPGKTLGPDPMPEDEKRQRKSIRFAPGYPELAKAIAEAKGLNGRGQAIELALDLMVEGDRALKIKLAEMGIILKARG